MFRAGHYIGYQGVGEETAADIVELAKTMLLHRKSSRIRKKMKDPECGKLLDANALFGAWFLGVRYLSPNKSAARKKLRI